MRPLRKIVDEYLALRRALGFKLVEPGHYLPQFVAFLEREGARTVTTELALAWAKEPSDATPRWWSKRLGIVRGFAAYLQAIDGRSEVPPFALLPCGHARAVPYFYAESDIAMLVEAAGGLSVPLRAATYATLIGLLATTGMRVGESIRLDRTDVDWPNGLVVVRNSKFGKSRAVPLHETTLRALRGYARLRDRFLPRPKAPSFFLSTRGTRLVYQNVRCTFRELARRIGLKKRSAHCRPRIHDLRHAFAVRTLLRWYREGVDVEARLPLLSTYLGHVDPTTTYWYLSAAPELLALACRRLENSLEDES